MCLKFVKRDEHFWGKFVKRDEHKRNNDAIDITRRELVDLLNLLCLNGCTHIISSVVLKWGNWSYIVLIIFKIETKKRQ